jgi:hypothetical protein
MNYQRIYDSICQRAKDQLEERSFNRKTNLIYYEGHHIIPKCMGGTGNSRNPYDPNIVFLTAKEHFICHKLLCEIYPDNKKVIHGYWLLAKVKGRGQERDHKIGSREYTRLRAMYSFALKGRIPWNKGLTREDPRVAKYADAKRWNAGLTADEDERVLNQSIKSSEARTGQKRKTYKFKIKN